MKHASYEGPLRSVAVRSCPSPKVRGSDRERQAMPAQERGPRGASPPPRRGCAAGRRRAQRSYSTSKVRRGGPENIRLGQGKEQWLHFAGAAVKRYPTSKVGETQVRREVLREGIRGQTHRNHNHRKLANLIPGPQSCPTQ